MTVKKSGPDSMPMMVQDVEQALRRGSIKVLANYKHKAPLPTTTAVQGQKKNVGVQGSRRIFSPAFKIKVLDSYRNDFECKGNQRATARKYQIHRRQIQKWLQCEASLRSCCAKGATSSEAPARPASSPDSNIQDHQQHQSVTSPAPALNLSIARLHGDELAVQQQQQTAPPPPPPPSYTDTAPTLVQQPVNNYRFHGTTGSTTVASATTLASSGYPDFKEKAPIPHPYMPTVPEYSMLYQPALAAAAYHQQLASQQPGYPLQYYRYENADLHPRVNYPHIYESKIGSSTPYFEERPGAFTSPSVLLTSTEIKTERASPDSEASHSHMYVPEVEKQQPLKREHFDEEEQHHRRSVTSYPDFHRSSIDYSPVPSHLDSLPPSPQDSDGSVGCSSSDEMDQRSLTDNTNNAQNRRRSFSLGFKVEVLNAYYTNPKCARNQRATARAYKINRRQVQKWLDQENSLRETYELYGGNNRQRLGPLSEESAVDLRTTELGQISPRSVSSNDGAAPYNYCRMSPTTYATALTPPYSTPGSTLSYSQELSSPLGSSTNAYYTCYSPSDAAGEYGKRLACSQSCCNPETSPSKRTKLETEVESQQPEQETPLCLVKPKEVQSSRKQQVESVSSTVPSPTVAPPNSNKDAILFKPYLDNPVSRPSSGSSPGNNNCQDARNLNEKRSADGQRQMPFDSRSQQFGRDESTVKSAFVRYQGHK